jgi:Trypsin
VHIWRAITVAPIWLANIKEISRPSPQQSEARMPPDLALLKLSNPLPSRFGPAFLSIRPVGVGDRMIVVGFGKTEERADVKRVDAVPRGQPRMTMLTVTRLSADLLELRNPPAGGDPRRLGTCYGDSGAPIFALRGGVPVLVAIVTGKPRGDECGGVTIATPLWRSRTWLLETASKLGSPLAP